MNAIDISYFSNGKTRIATSTWVALTHVIIISSWTHFNVVSCNDEGNSALMTTTITTTYSYLLNCNTRV